ncbi:C2H2-like zinc finger protein [Hirschfeldia incana]|nr:C2H2-like zinc finger protein [Hirschfeldia incana]
MQKHKCKLCSKSFCNGRALGGHMKSHLVSSHTPTKKKLLGDSVYSSFSSSDGKPLAYGLRENPRKSCRVFNPDPEASTVYNSETETEPESVDPVQKRGRGEDAKKKTKKTRSKKRVSENSDESGKKQKRSKSNSNESPEPASSVSDGSPEQDLAMCLMMLSRDSREVKLKKPEEMKPELRRCMIDLNLPPPQESDVVSAI